MDADAFHTSANANAMDDAVTGGFPTARFGHRAVLLETQVVVFGGYNGAHKRRAEGQKGLDDNLIALDSRTLEWWKPSSEGFAPGLR